MKRTSTYVCALQTFRDVDDKRIAAMLWIILPFAPFFWLYAAAFPPK